jgi:lipoyl(octanoyl) transferase
VASSKDYSGRLIQDEPHGGAFNMAADIFLANQARITNEIILRLYSWEVPTLSLGYHQRLSEEQINRCQAQGVPVVRRPTGGRAVLHDREVTYAVVIPLQHRLMQKGRESVLRSIGEAFVASGVSVGLKAELVRAGEHPRNSEGIHCGNPLCFDSVSRWEVRLNGQKWIGSAQRLLPEAFLQHGSILTGTSRVDLADLMGVPGRATGFEEGIIDEIALRQAIPSTLSEFWKVSWQEEGFSGVEFEQISRLIDTGERLDQAYSIDRIQHPVNEESKRMKIIPEEPCEK